MKRAIGDEVLVEADVFTDGHDAVVAELLWRHAGARDWQVVPMQFLGNDHWSASFRVAELGRYEYTVRGWTDPFLTWQRDLKKRQEADQDLSIDFLIGGALSCNPVLKDAARPAKERYATAIALKPPPPDDLRISVYDKTLQVSVDPVRARFRGDRAATKSLAARCTSVCSSVSTRSIVMLPAARGRASRRC